MKIYNTLTKKKEEFIPLEAGKVKMYVCGPTVYNYIHIGNARPIIVFDTVRRYLEYKGYDVNFVSNFTDVDDKIIKKALEEGVSASDISERYIGEYRKDVEGLNVEPATFNPKATEEIEGMIEMISTLIQKGHAYEKNGTVYFRTRSFTEYGKLSKKNIDDLEAGIRIAVSEEKDDPMDFVLWKPKKDGEPFWESPWSEGRPGWHIECSVMSKKYLGEAIDIHAGGEDLIFPHHENEIAQSEACNGKEFAKYWMHNGFLNIDNKKMSKSTGNFFTVREISESYDLSVLRFFMLSAHYRSPINFSRDLMEASKNALDRIQTAAGHLTSLLEAKSQASGQAILSAEAECEMVSGLEVDKKHSISKDEEEILKEAAKFQEKFEAAMDDDFNTADAISAIFELVKLSNTNGTAESSPALLQELLKLMTSLCEVLGIKAIKKDELLDEEIEGLIKERQEARKQKDFKRSDEIRDLLLEKGIVLEDTREGVRWKRA